MLVSGRSKTPTVAAQLYVINGQFDINGSPLELDSEISNNETIVGDYSDLSGVQMINMFSKYLSLYLTN